MTEAVVIGPGAIGALIFLELQRAGITAGSFGRGGPSAFIAKIEDAGIVRSLQIPAGNLAAAKMLFIAVKATDLAEALHAAGKVASGTAVIPFCNGAIYTILARAKAARPDLRWRLGLATVGVTAPASEHFVVRSSVGELTWGPFAPDRDSPTPSEQKLTQQPSTRFHWQPDMFWLHRRKWLFNTVINSLAAVSHYATNGELLRDQAKLFAVFTEAHTLGENLWGTWPWPKGDLFQSMLDLIQATSDNENSMARDVRLGRRTETDALAGLASDDRLYPLLCRLHSQLSPRT